MLKYVGYCVNRVLLPCVEDLPRWRCITNELPDVPRVGVVIHVFLPELRQMVMNVYITLGFLFVSEFDR